MSDEDKIGKSATNTIADVKKASQSLSSFTDKQYEKLRNARYRAFSKASYPLFRLLYKTLNKSLDFFILDLRDPKPEIISSKQVSYDLYRRVQIEANIRKLASGQEGWEDRLALLVDDIVANYAKNSGQVHQNGVLKGVCMGARNGSEVKAFQQLLEQAFARQGHELEIKVIGTDISPTAAAFPNMIVHDFHDPVSDNIGKVDFIYSNSHDQAQDPEKALGAWIASLKDDGTLYLEHMRGHGKQSLSLLDPFSCETEIFPFQFLKWFGGKAAIEKVLFPRPNIETHVFFVIKKLWQ